MKKNVNTFLLLIIVIIIGSLAAVTIVYQKTYKNLSKSYDERIDEINTLISDLNSERETLNETTYDLLVKQEREKALSGQYKTVKGERDKLDSDLQTTERELQNKVAELRNTIAALQTTQHELQVSTEALVQSERSRATCEDAKQDYKNQLKACQEASS